MWWLLIISRQRKSFLCFQPNTNCCPCVHPLLCWHVVDILSCYSRFRSTLLGSHEIGIFSVRTFRPGIWAGRLLVAIISSRTSVWSRVGWHVCTVGTSLLFVLADGMSRFRAMLIVMCMRSKQDCRAKDCQHEDENCTRQLMLFQNWNIDIPRHSCDPTRPENYSRSYSSTVVPVDWQESARLFHHNTPALTQTW